MRVTTLWLSVLLLCSLAAWAQDSPKGRPSPDEPGYGQGPYVVDDDLIRSPWRDPVHWLGIIGTALAFAVALGGAVIYLGFGLRGKPYSDPSRRLIRIAHIIGGFVAVGLGTGHTIGRMVQMEEAWFGWIPPAYAQVGFLVVLASGILRTWTPRPLRKRWFVFAWIHRFAVVAALYYAVRHSLYQLHKFEER